MHWTPWPVRGSNAIGIRIPIALAPCEGLQCNSDPDPNCIGPLPGIQYNSDPDPNCIGPPPGGLRIALEPLANAIRIRIRVVLTPRQEHPTKKESHCARPPNLLSIHMYIYRLYLYLANIYIYIYIYIGVTHPSIHTNKLIALRAKPHTPTHIYVYIQVFSKYIIHPSNKCIPKKMCCARTPTNIYIYIYMYYVYVYVFNKYIHDIYIYIYKFANQRDPRVVTAISIKEF